MSEAIQTQAGAQPGEVSTRFSEFEDVLKKRFKVNVGSEKEKVIKSAIGSLVEQALLGQATIGDDVLKTISAMKSMLDAKISEQLNEIMHHEDFQKLESAWRGLHYLVNNTDTDPTLKIRVMNISKADAAASLKKFRGTAWDQSPLFKKIYGAEFDMLGGTPYGTFLADYYFDNSPEDVALLKDIARIASAAHAPFISAADPGLLNLDSWLDLSKPRDLSKIFESPTHAEWKAFRQTEDSNYVGLAMPRFLGRLPYDGKSADGKFAFQEKSDGADHDKYLWLNAAYAMGANITRSFKNYGWCSMIRGVESGGTQKNLPVHTFPTDDGGVDMKCPTEIAIGDRRGSELDRLGLMPFFHRKGEPEATFIAAQSVNAPAKFYDMDATANANITARLDYLFPVCRFAHYLKAMVRDKIGTFKERADMEKWLNDWIHNFVCDSSAGDFYKAKQPLAAAEVKVQDVPGNPGYYAAQFWLRPHFKLEGLSASLRLVSKLPSVKKGG